MTNLRTEEMVFFPKLTKIDTDENKAFYSIHSCHTEIFEVIINCKLLYHGLFALSVLFDAMIITLFIFHSYKTSFLQLSIKNKTDIL